MSTWLPASVDWQFAEPLGRLPQPTAEKVVIAAAVIGLLWIIASYTWTLARLGVVQRLVLCSMRGLFWLALLVALLGPTRVTVQSVKREPRPVAVLVDCSDSMTERDARRQSRLDDAVRRWRAIEPTVVLAARHYSFARELTETAGVAQGPATATDATLMYDSLLKLMKQAPVGGWGGVVVLTDGLDTSGERPLDHLAASALATGTPLYFVVGENQPAPREMPPFVNWLELNVPANVAPNALFVAELTIESFQSAPQKIPVRLKVGERWSEAEPMFLNAGRRATVWRTRITASDRGVVPIELRADDGANELVARAEVRVVRQSEHKRLLNYAVALDWGQAFLDRMLRGDAVLAVETVFQPVPSVDPAAVPRFPSTAEQFDDYDAVVLSGASASRLTPAQAELLIAWVRRGGALLLVVPELGAAEGLIASPLREVSPLIFAPPPPASPEPDAIRQVRLSHPQNIRFISYDGEVKFADALVKAMPPVRRNTFEWSPRVAEELGVPGELARPVYAFSAPPVQLAPGAEVLARRPATPTTGPEAAAAVFAMQRFGAGRVATLACDALWQWKMSLPDSSAEAERFWRTWFRWFATQPEHQLQFVHAPLYTEAGRPTTFRVAGRYSRMATNLYVREDQGKGKVELKGRDQEASTYTWTPARPGFWTLEAQDETGGTARHWVTVRPVGGDRGPAVTGEKSGRPPDESLLRELAARTGGAVLADVAPSAWTANGKARTDVLSERRTLLWHDPRWFALVLVLYLLDLLLRRAFRML